MLDLLSSINPIPVPEPDEVKMKIIFSALVVVVGTGWQVLSLPARRRGENFLSIFWQKKRNEPLPVFSALRM